jgi:cellulose synthase/poly-beta-1,6-N-acetylglucosamine synthase-like glycosyltransferase
MQTTRTESRLTVIVPAYNEADSVGATVRSLLDQTTPPARVLVIDDCSTDATGQAAAAAGAAVITPTANTGSKAGAQTFALDHVDSELVMAVDADTTLAPDAVETLLAAFDDDSTVAACGSVLPRHVRTTWERGRYVEYLFAFSFFKRIQDHFGKPMIASGCFSAYRTAVLRDVGGWSTRTMAEDMDLTWTLYRHGHGVRFVPEAVCYPIEPHDLPFLTKQLRRWSHGFVQNVRIHRRALLDLGFLRSAVAVAFWDSVFASLAYLLLLPLLAVLVSPAFLLAYLIDAPVVLVPVLHQAAKRREVRRALASLPGFFALRVVNGIFMLSALWRELIAGRPLLVYEKGH